MCRARLPSVGTRLSSENDRWFEYKNAADANQTSEPDYQEHDHSDAGHDLPRQNDSARRQVVHSSGKEGRGNAQAEGVAGDADNQCLQQNHPYDPPIGHPNRLQRAKLFQVLDSKDVKRLPEYDRADDESNDHRYAEVHRYTCVAQI